MPRNEEQLHGGNATDAVMRVGNTVRKPWQENTPAVHRFMEHLRDQGLSEVPRTYGKDPQGRQVVEFVAGTPAAHDRPLPADLLSTVGRRIRSIHDCAAGFTPAPGEHWSSLIPVADAELICHNDLAPWNLVLGDEPVFIDWDGAGPSTRLWDLSYAAQSFAFLVAAQDPHVAAVRLRSLVVEGYAAESEMCAGLPSTMIERTRAMYDFLRAAHREDHQPWGQMFLDGHGEHWAGATRFVEEHLELWVRALCRDEQPA